MWKDEVNGVGGEELVGSPAGVRLLHKHIAVACISHLHAVAVAMEHHMSHSAATRIGVVLVGDEIAERISHRHYSAIG